MADPLVRAAVIGSGFGGLAAAIRLQSAGVATTIYEARDLPGGRAYVYQDGGYTFDAGPTVITAPHCLEELFTLSGRKMSDYLDVAGVDAEADMGNSFIARADGTVLHASRRGWFNDLESTELMPGDTLVVPEKGNRETFWTAFTRGLKDWSQILYQFGLAAAAIQTLRN